MDITVGKLLEKKGTRVFSVEKSVPIHDCALMLQQAGVGSLLILDDEHHLVGILYERDIARIAVVRNMDLVSTPVSEIMSKKFPTVRRDTMVSCAMKIINDERVRHLPVIEDSVVYGLVSIGDLNNHILEAQQDDIDHLVDYISGGRPISFATPNH
ncbi:MAG: histidine kinase [Coxiellaceae bacterium]|nr:histidine kinase [Coxiellaceae bacterium]|tara:strand:+ start:3855 stop:4322 length:468 start_codon:yes stop_codon:yes gene_type:complete